MKIPFRAAELTDGLQGARDDVHAAAQSVQAASIAITITMAILAAGVIVALIRTGGNR